MGGQNPDIKFVDTIWYKLSGHVCIFNYTVAIPAICSLYSQQVYKILDFFDKNLIIFRDEGISQSSLLLVLIGGILLIIPADEAFRTTVGIILLLVIITQV